MNRVDQDVVKSFQTIMENTYGALGFEFQPFKIGWYNAFVQPTFKLNYHEDTVAFLIVSSPKMFEKAFVPFLKIHRNKLNGIKDPIDECMTFYFSKLPELFSEYSVKLVYDFELHPNRRPKIIMQCAAHASGTAYLYHPDNVTLNNSIEHKQKLFGVCIHPKYGGWFSLRAVAFFENLQCPNLTRIPPLDLIPSVEDKIKLLELFNYSWRDWKFRDIIPVTEKYSDIQMKYFNAPPGSRDEIIKEILRKYDTINLI